MSSTFALRRKRARTSTRLSKVLQNRNQRLFHNTDEHNTYHDTQGPHPLLTGDGASKQRSDDNKWWQSKRSSSFDEAQDKAQTPSQRLVNDKTVFSASFGVIFKKTSQMASPFDQNKKTKQLWCYLFFLWSTCAILNYESGKRGFLPATINRQIPLSQYEAQIWDRSLTDGVSPSSAWRPVCVRVEVCTFAWFL